MLAAIQDGRRTPHHLRRLRHGGLLGAGVVEGSEVELLLPLEASPQGEVQHALLLVPIQGAAMSVPALAAATCESKEHRCLLWAAPLVPLQTAGLHGWPAREPPDLLLLLLLHVEI